MSSSVASQSAEPRPLRRVLILADESAHWKIAGLRQLDRLLLTLQEHAQAEQPRESMDVCVFWRDETRRTTPDTARLSALEITDEPEDFLASESPIDLVISTRLFVYRDGISPLLAQLPAPGPVERNCVGLWQNHELRFSAALKATSTTADAERAWTYVATESEIGSCEWNFLEQSGKSQDGLASRYINRPLSRWLSRWLLKLPLTPSTWSALIFALPVCATFYLIRGTYAGFLIGCAIFQLYSILDGCDGEIARAKFLQSEFGRRLDSMCDLAGNVLLALGLGVGLARQAHASAWVHLAEGLAAAALTLTSEGIVFLRRSRAESTPRGGKWNGVLYQRHHEFLERSGILFVGEDFAWWLVQLTKRDMAMLAFLVFALAGFPALNLHLLFLVGAISSALAGNAFLRHAAPAPAVPQEAS